MQHEVRAEASLHTGRAVVRRVLLDPRTAHVDDFVVAYLEVDLTADAAIRTDGSDLPVGCGHVLGAHPIDRRAIGGANRHRDDVVNGARGADADALAAPRAAGVLRVAVSPNDDLRVVAPIRY